MIIYVSLHMIVVILILMLEFNPEHCHSFASSNICELSVMFYLAINTEVAIGRR